MPGAEFKVGELIENRYRILSVLGGGGMGRVYQVADETQPGRVLALKTLNLTLPASEMPAIIARFQREFRMLAQMRHPNLMNVYNYGVASSGNLFFTMEYVQGADLKAYAAQAGTAGILPVIVQVCRALAYIHARQVIHGDLKPSNILVVEDQIKILDFGVAVETRLPQTDNPYGTMGYTAPEALHSLPLDHRADLYSLGAIWYELFVGEPPLFIGSQDRMIWLMLQNSLMGQQDVSPQTAKIIARLLSKDPAARYANANEVITAVNEASGCSFALETRETAASYALQGRLVGREEELAALQASWQRSQASLGEINLIEGESGAGKSRLLEEFVLVAELGGARTIQGRCIETGAAPYQPWREILRILFRYVESEAPAAALQLGPVLTVLLPELWQRPYMAELSPPVSLDLQAERLRLNETIAQILRLVAHRPTVITIEDAHWADEASLELLSFLNRVIGFSGLMICLTYRNEEVDPEHLLLRLEGPRIQRIVVGTLSLEQIGEVVASMLGLEKLPPLLVDRVRNTTGGNAFFIQELVRSLAEDGVVLNRSASGWTVNLPALADASLPDSIRQVTARRFARLPAQEQETMQLAALMGNIFWPGALEHIAGLPANSLAEPVLSLQKKELVFERKPSVFQGEQEFLFKNPVLRDVGYTNAEKLQLPGRHARAARWLIDQSGSRADEFAGQIAEQYQAAGLPLQAGEWFGRAGGQARAGYAPAAAIAYYQKALHLLEETGVPPSMLVELYQGLGESLLAQAHYDRAVQVYQSMLKAAASRGDTHSIARAHLGLTEVLDMLGEYQEVIQNGQLAEKACVQAGPAARPELARALIRQGWAYYRLGESAQALELAQKALALCARINARPELANVYNLTAGIYNMLGEYQKTTFYNESSLALYRELGNRQRVSGMLNNLGEYDRLMGNFQNAVRRYQEALQIAREIGFRAGEMIFLCNLGGVLAELGRYEEAEATLREAMYTTELDDFGVLSEILCHMAKVYLGQGKEEEALTTAQKALALGQAHDEPVDIGTAWRILGKVLARRSVLAPPTSGPSDPAQCFSESLKVFTGTKMEAERARTLREWAQFEIAQGDPARGAAMWLEARQIFERLGMDLEIRKMDQTS